MNPTKGDVQEIVRKEIEKFVKDNLDKAIKDAMKNSNSATRKEMIDTIKNSIESVYKMFWYKRDFWKSDIK